MVSMPIMLDSGLEAPPGEKDIVSVRSALAIVFVTLELLVIRWLDSLSTIS